MAENDRITAFEMEYMSQCQTVTDPNFHFRLAGDKLTKEELEKHRPEGLIGLEYLSNGSRMYIDSGDQLEYCTPEETSFWGTVKNELAGEAICRDTYDNMVADSRHPLTAYKFNKRLIDDEGYTAGHHENYSSETDTNLEINAERLSLLGLHLATRNIYLGEGYARTIKGVIDLRMAQKAPNVHLDYNKGTTGGSKPIVNLKQEPLANSRQYRRVHVTSGDANMSPWAMWMTVGTTSIVLRLIEQSYDSINIQPQITLVQMAKLVSSDLEFTQKIPLHFRSAMTAGEIQQEIVNRACIYHEKEGLSKQEIAVLDEWQRALDDLKTDPTRLEDRSSGIAKLMLIDDYRYKLQGKHLSKEKVAQKLIILDKLWDEISDRGIGLKYRQTKWAAWMPSQDEIQKAILNPPQNTRAKIRGDLIRDHWPQIRGGGKANWDVISYRDFDAPLGNPFQSVL